MSNLPERFSAMPDLDPLKVGAVISQMVDMVMFLSPMQDILEVRTWGALADFRCDTWAGQGFATVLAPDSRSKLAMVLETDATVAPDAVRWRHVNLRCSEGETLPVLVKYFVLGEGEARVRMIVARDLRPTVSMQTRFQRACVEMENALANQPPPTAGPGAAVVGQMLATVGHRPLHQIVTETVRVLERICVAEALRKTEGDSSSAAALLGIDEDTLRGMRLQ
jgi:hypothetical protein